MKRMMKAEHPILMLRKAWNQKQNVVIIVKRNRKKMPQNVILCNGSSIQGQIVGREGTGGEGLGGGGGQRFQGFTREINPLPRLSTPGPLMMLRFLIFQSESRQKNSTLTKDCHLFS